MKGALAFRTPALPLLRLSNVGKTHTTHDAVEAIHSVDLEVTSGELVAVVGAPGCGTTTLLAMVAGLEPTTRGRITCNGRRVRGTGPDRALLIKEAGLLPWLDARRNVELALRDRRIPAFERAAIARRCLDVVSPDLQAVLFPAHFGAADLLAHGLRRFVRERLDQALTNLSEQVRRGLLLQRPHDTRSYENCEDRAVDFADVLARRRT
jgi:ABC-type sugar transport system ATPase subunit